MILGSYVSPRPSPTSFQKVSDFQSGLLELHRGGCNEVRGDRENSLYSTLWISTHTTWESLCWDFMRDMVARIWQRRFLPSQSLPQLQNPPRNTISLPSCNPPPHAPVLLGTHLLSVSGWGFSSSIDRLVLLTHWMVWILWHICNIHCRHGGLSIGSRAAQDQAVKTRSWY